MENTPFIRIFCPLIGADCESLGGGFITSETKIGRPNPETWKFLNNLSVYAEMARQQLSLMCRPENIPVCFTFDLPGITIQNLEEKKPVLLRKSEETILVLRLYRDGWFFHPMQYQLYFVLFGDEVTKGRYTGPYRQMNFDHYGPMCPKNKYCFYATDVTDQAPGSAVLPIAPIVKLVRSYYSLPPNTSVDFAIASFTRSYNCISGYAEKAGMLFSLFDAIVCDIKQERLNGTAITLPFERRMQLLLAGYPAAEKEIAWLADHTETGARRCRNLIAHGQSDDAEVCIRRYEIFPRLQSIARHMLKKYMQFYCLTCRDTSAARRPWLDNRKTLTERFYLLLDLADRKNPEALNLVDMINRPL